MNHVRMHELDETIAVGVSGVDVGDNRLLATEVEGSAARKGVLG